MTVYRVAGKAPEGKDEARIVPFSSGPGGAADTIKASVPHVDSIENQRAMTLDGLESWLALRNASVWLDMAEAKAEAAAHPASL